MNTLTEIINALPMQVLGWTIIHTFWIGLIVWPIYTIGKNIFTKSSLQRYYWAFAMQILLFVGFASAFTFEYSKYQKESDRVEVIHTVPVNQKASAQLDQLVSMDISNRNFFEIIDAITPVLSILWILGIFVMMARFITSLFYIQNLKSTGIVEIEKHWEGIFNDLVAITGIKRVLKIFESELITTPMTIGHFKPVVLIPLGMLSQLPSEQIEAILLHELAHIKRSDYLINLFQNLLESLVFFHPVTWILSANIRNERENICDDYSVQKQDNPIHLAKALFELQKTYLHIPDLAMGSNKGEGLLLKRINRLFGLQEISRNKFGSFVSFLLILLVFSFAFGFKLKKEKNAHTEPLSNTFENKDELEELQNEKNIAFVDFNSDEVESDILTKRTKAKIQQANKNTSGNSGIIFSNNGEKNNARVNSNGNDNEVTLKTTTSDGRKMELVFVDAQTIKKFKLAGKVIDPLDYDKYRDLLNKEVFNKFLQTYNGTSKKTSSKTNTVYHRKSQDDGTIIHAGFGSNRNKIFIKLDDGEDNVISIDLENLEDLDELTLLNDELSKEIETILENFNTEKMSLQFDFDYDDQNSFSFKSSGDFSESERANLEETLELLNVKLKEMESKLEQQEFRRVEQGITKTIHEIERELKELEEKKSNNISIEYNGKSAANGYNPVILESLKKDGLIKKNAKQYELQFKKGIMKVDGIKQNEKLSKKYMKLLDIGPGDSVTMISVFDENSENESSD